MLSMLTRKEMDDVEVESMDGTKLERDGYGPHADADIFPVNAASFMKARLLHFNQILK